MPLYVQNGNLLKKAGTLGTSVGCCCDPPVPPAPPGCCETGLYLPNSHARSTVSITYEATPITKPFSSCWPQSPKPTQVAAYEIEDSVLWTLDNEPGPAKCSLQTTNRATGDQVSFIGSISLYKQTNTGKCMLASSHAGNFGLSCAIGGDPLGYLTEWEFEFGKTTYTQTVYWFQYTYQNGGLINIISDQPTPAPDPPPTEDYYFPPRVWSYSGVRTRVDSELVFE